MASRTSGVVRRFLSSHATGLFLAVSAGIAPAWADTCLEEAAGGQLTCSGSGPVVDVIEITRIYQECEAAGDIFTFDGILHVQPDASTKYDVGFYLGADSLNSPDDDCHLAVVDPDELSNPQDGDVCGDIASSAYVPVQQVSVLCKDGGTIEIEVCTAWNDTPDPTDCTMPELALPASPSMCNCAIVAYFLPDPVCVTNADCTVEANVCIDDICDVTNPESDAFGCIYVDNTAPCSDPLFCTVGDVCSRGSCIAGAERVCDDGTVCTEDACSESVDACVFTPVSGACDDGDPCTEDDACVAGECVGVPVSCDDQNICTTDTCDGTSPCTHEPVPNCPTTTLPPQILCGDANGDGKVLAGDAALVLRHAVGGESGSCDPLRCDTNRNGTLTAGDALTVLRIAVGLLTSTEECPLAED